MSSERASDRATPRTLADALRTWDDESLAALLLTRPDLARPAPVDVGQLAARAGGRGSVAFAIDRLDTAHLAVLEALAGEDDRVGADRLEQIVYARPATVRELVAELRSRALIWGDDSGLRPVRAVRDVLGPAPAGLGPSLSALLVRQPPAAVHALVDGLDLPAADPRTDVARLAAAYTDPSWAQAQIASARAAAGDDVLRLLDRLSDGPPSGRLGQVPADVTISTARDPLEHLLARALLVATDPRTVTLPREVGLLRRGGHTTREPVDEPPPVPTVQVDLARADRVGASAAFDLTRRVELMLDAWGTRPPPVLRSGGVGVREVRALATGLDVDADQAGFLVELASAAGLLARGDDSDGEGAWLPTQAFDNWRERPTAHRWRALAGAWLRMPRATALVGDRDEHDRPVAALAPDLERGAVATVRAAALEGLAALAPGCAPESTDDLVARVAWARPRRTLLRDRTVRQTVIEAAWLGVTALGAMTSHGRLLVRGDDPVAALDPLLPEPVDHLLLQADLTAVAPGPLDREVAHGIAMLADVESRGGATVYRFTSASLRRALDAGWPASQLHAFLATHSRTPVPQPLTYLIDDTARRHGRLRVGSADVYVRSDDPADLDTLLAERSLAPLRLRRLAPTVALSDVSGDVVLARLRAAGREPVLEDAGGRSAETPAPVRRATTVVAMVTASALGPSEVAAVVAAVRAGERARVARPAPAGGPVAPTLLVEQLRAAVEDGGSLWLAYLDETGTVSERVVDPVGVDGGRLTAYDHRSARTRSFALHRISRVASAG